MTTTLRPIAALLIILAAIPFAQPAQARTETVSNNETITVSGNRTETTKSTTSDKSYVVTTVSH